MNMRISKTNYYLDIAETVSERCTCLRRRYGAIIVKNDSIVSTGYNGAPRGRENCSDMGFCLRIHFDQSWHDLRPDAVSGVMLITVCCIHTIRLFFFF